MSADVEAPRVLVRVVDGVGHLRLNRPERRNAVDVETVRQARAAIEGFAAAGVVVGVVEAEGAVFCAGGDRAEAGTEHRSSTRLVQVLVEAPLFWAARVQGPALGGGVAMAAVCPVTVCTPEAWFHLPEVAQGFLPGPVLAFLEPVLGARAALRLCLSPDRLSAARAVEVGLVDEVAPAEALDERIAERLAPLVARPHVARAAADAWRAHFSGPSFNARLTSLLSLL